MFSTFAECMDAFIITSSPPFNNPINLNAAVTQSVDDGHARVERLPTILGALVAFFIGGRGAAHVALQQQHCTETRSKVRLRDKLQATKVSAGLSETVASRFSIRGQVKKLMLEKFLKMCQYFHFNFSFLYIKCFSQSLKDFC